LSGLLLVSYNEPIGTRLRVVVGAFKNEDNATWMLRKLKQFGFDGKLITP
jgi:cell division protein FtsN